MHKNKLKDQICEELDERFISALSYAENHDIDWQYALIMGTFHLMEYSNYQSDGDIVQASALMLFAMKTSLLRRMNENLLDEIAAEFSITIEAGPKIRGNESQAVTILIAAMQSCVEEMFISQGAVTRGLH